MLPETGAREFILPVFTRQDLPDSLYFTSKSKTGGSQTGFFYTPDGGSFQFFLQKISFPENTMIGKLFRG